MSIVSIAELEIVVVHLSQCKALLEKVAKAGKMTQQACENTELLKYVKDWNAHVKVLKEIAANGALRYR